MYQHFLMTGLYSVGLMIGYLLVPFIVRKIQYTEEEGIDLDQHYDKIFLACKFADEVEEAPQSTLTEEELKELKHKILHYEIPYLNQEVILYYDHEKEAFEYYASSSIIYKYLNVAARRYVLDFGCKQIFKEMAPSLKTEEKTVQFGPFVPKVGKTFLQKEMNRFIYQGNLKGFDVTNKHNNSRNYSYSENMKVFGEILAKPKPPEPKKIDFSEYMKMLEKVAREPELEPAPFVPTPIPETKSTILDFLKHFSSTPKSQSIKTD